MLTDEDLLAYCKTLCGQADVCYFTSPELMQLAELAGETSLAMAMRRIDFSHPGFVHAYRSSRILALFEQARMRWQNILFLETLLEERRRNFLSLAFENFSSNEIDISRDHFDEAHNQWQEAERLLDHCRKLPANWRKENTDEGKSVQEDTYDEEPARVAAE